MDVEIWSDVVCPWCYVGKRRFEAALAQFAHRDDVQVVWRSFELDPSAPFMRTGPYAERLAAKYGMSVADAKAAVDRMTAMGAQDGVFFRFDLAQPGNTFDAHRLLHWAHGLGRQDALKERLLQANFTEGACVSDPDVLVALAAEVGLPADEARAVLERGDYGDEVRADEQRAARLGINAVPFFVIDGRYGVPGAQPTDVFLRVLEDTWAEAEREPAPVVVGGAAEACSDDSCAV